MASHSERRNAGTRGPGSARDRVLDAYETLLIEQGPGGATLDAVAAAAEVSKGGLLYHFNSKESLVGGLLERLRERSARDAELMRSDTAGTVAYYLRTSMPGNTSPVGLTRTYLATLRIADGTTSGEAARSALADVDADGLAALGEEIHDPVVAWLVQLVGDGLYLRTLTGAPLTGGVSTDELLDTLRELLAARS
ncbi:TetR/AcrR family transcriptional regulator [Pseudonocardia alni]|jgi:AcrR family transcriptional regulator|uniref:AcrR family transcriptional regulator n=3 Tax=Pseudonocardia TaxID=1847 RepID=A0A852W1J5_PSEA5|nr:MULTISPECIES: TetR/AcrR family transcriptional regulator [Pseudonocardia]NWJ72905.1 TetR/AcrR family transcriptional regulator [Pseudonocardia pini]OJG06338.1 Biofilm operon icaADBC HTH-type negative transcriptional regulator IcaR [Pseudonocardia autotrophica]ALE79696.1 TetR family transcriptional regulator [Pseudonocardia sp. AL041005-10]MBO4239056.1 TetR family transcriptional regulator [Pseudonocardia alni]MCM3846002.1 TetR/AcrR family transcriptional regulator [Pseudonocardia sp. DR1-2]